MTGNTGSSGDSPEISPYTLTMARCLEGLSDDKDAIPSNGQIHVLMNMVQGRMLEYLADEICRDHGILDTRSKNAIVTALLGIFSDEFFALFRSKIKNRPELALLIARRIIRGEYDSQNGGAPSTARLFPAIFRKYFEYRNLDSLLHMVESDSEIQKIVLLSLLERRLKPDHADLCGEIARILEDDREGICPNLFMECLSEKGLEALREQVQSGTWRADMEGVKEKIALLRGE